MLIDVPSCYDGLDDDARSTLVALSLVVRRGKADYVASVLRIGSAIHDAHGLLAVAGRDGKFSAWLAEECGIERSTAYNYLNAFNAFANCPTVGQFSAGALYALSAPTAPIEARQEAIRRSQVGEKITKALAAEIIVQKQFAFANEVDPPARNRELSFVGTGLALKAPSVADCLEYELDIPVADDQTDAGPTLAPVIPATLKEWIFRYADKMQIARWWFESCSEGQRDDCMTLLDELYSEAAA